MTSRYRVCFLLHVVIVFQAYVVFKYSEKEQPQTTIRGGSKYIAAPLKSSTGGATHMSTLNSSGCHGNSLIPGDDPSSSLVPEVSGPTGASSMEKDIQVGNQ